MKNTINIIKYNLREQKNLFIIEGSILLLFTILSLVAPSWFSLSILMVTAVSTILTVNFIIGIIRFAKGISAEEGRVLFLAPIKGWQYLLAKNLENLIIQSAIVLLAYICTIISGDGGSLVGIVGLSTGFGLTISYIFITSFMPIVSSYFRKTFVRVIITIIAFIIYGIFGLIIEILTYELLPYVYMIIGDFVEINLLSTVFNLIGFGAIIWIAIYHIDNKLDII